MLGVGCSWHFLCSATCTTNLLLYDDDNDKVCWSSPACHRSRRRYTTLLVVVAVMLLMLFPALTGAAKLSYRCFLLLLFCCCCKVSHSSPRSASNVVRVHCLVASFMRFKNWSFPGCCCVIVLEKDAAFLDLGASTPMTGLILLYL